MVQSVGKRCQVPFNEIHGIRGRCAYTFMAAHPHE